MAALDLLLTAAEESRKGPARPPEPKTTTIPAVTQKCKLPTEERRHEPPRVQSEEVGTKAIARDGFVYLCSSKGAQGPDFGPECVKMTSRPRNFFLTLAPELSLKESR